MESVIAYCNDDVLQHHGIKGQKWGVRRYQNPDGTLTEEGKEHYAYNVFPQEARAQAFLRVKAKPENVKNSHTTGATVGALAGSLPGIVDGFKIGGPIGAALGGVATASIGGVLGLSISKIEEKINKAQYKSSQKKVANFLEKHGNEKVDDLTLSSHWHSYEEFLTEYFGGHDEPFKEERRI
jgi:hypothetical protein